MENRITNLYTLVFFLMLGLSIKSTAQDQGSFFIRNHEPKEYRKQTKDGSPDNHAILQDERGVIYISNNAGLLEYDGTRWKLLPYGNGQKHDIRSLTKTPEGNIAVAGRTELGIFTLNERGEYSYQSLKSQLEDDSLNQLTFWHTYTHENQVYFVSFYPAPLRVYRLEHNKIQLETKIEQAEKARFYVVNGTIYSHMGEKGFNRLVDGKWEMYKGTEAWKDLFIYKVVERPNNQLLAGTFSGELYVLDLTNQAEPIQLENEASTYCQQNQLLHIECLSDGNMLFGTVKGGAFIANPAGKIIKTINKNNNLQDNIVFDALEDKQGGIWLALFNGVSRVQINSPLNFWGEDLGLEGRASAVTRYKGVLFVNTVLGSYYLKNGVFHKIPNSPLESNYTFQFHPNGDSTQSKLLLSGFDGLYEVTVDEAQTPSLQKIDKTYGRTYYASVSPNNPNRLYLSSGIGGISILDYENGTWQPAKRLRMDGRRLGGSVNEDKDGTIWLSSFGNQDQDGEMTRIRLDDSLKIVSATFFDTANYQIPAFNWHTIHNDTLLAFSNKGLYYFDKSSERFKVHQGFGGIFAQGLASPNIHYIDTKNGHIWLDLVDQEGRATGKMGIYYKLADGSYQLDSTSLVRLSEETVGSWLYTEGSVCWLPTSNGVYRFDSKLSAEDQQPYPAIIRKVSIGQDSILFNGNFFFKDQDAKGHETVWMTSLSQIETPELDYCHNTVKIEFSALFFEKSEELEYSYLLDGLSDATWSKWEPENKVTFNNLREGQYTIKVKARNIYGQESLSASYSFEILPPWQRTKLAYTSYASLLSFLIWGIVRLNGIRLKKHNEMLTKLVRERTHEIHSKNEELRTQQEEILSQSENLRQANEEILVINESLKEQKEEVEQTNDVLHQQKAELQKAYNHITDSVRYAQRIQRAILGEAESIVNGFQDGFIYFKPRDIVSGDFYWYSEVAGKKIVIAADCTGHGVPGAFMTVMGNSMLHQIINEGRATCPSKILKELDKRITKATSTKSANRTIHDGMDVAIAVFDDQAGQVAFAGAKNPMIVIQDGTLTVLKGSKFPVGGSSQFKTEKEFEVQHLSYQTGDRFYLFSDGFQDQFGGAEDTKYLKKRFRGLIASHSFLPMNDQKEKLDSEFKHWKGQKAQTDDILVIGLQVG